MRVRRVHYPPKALGDVIARRRAFGGRVVSVIGVVCGGVPGCMMIVGAGGSRGWD